MKSLVIKTASNVIYVVNGKVSCVRCAITGRFVAVKKFANIVNNLIVKAKNADEARKADSNFFFTNKTRLAMSAFKNMAKMAKALLGDVLVYTSRNYTYTDFNINVLSSYA